MQVFVQLGAMVNKVSEFGLLGWFGRVRLINCICDFVLLNPQIGQVPTSHITHLFLRHGELAYAIFIITLMFLLLLLFHEAKMFPPKGFMT